MTIPDPLPRRMSRAAAAAEPASPLSDSNAYSPAVAPAPASWPWRRAALLLSIAAQLISIAALLGVNPPPVTWAALLLAITPAPLAALAAFTPPTVARIAVVVAGVVLVAGIAGTVTHTGLFFVPALAAHVGAAILLWREQA